MFELIMDNFFHGGIHLLSQSAFLKLDTCRTCAHNATSASVALIALEAVTYATYLKNQSPTRAIKVHKVSDEEVFLGKKPDASHWEEFGRKCWVLQQNEKISKLDPKSKQFIFVSIGDGTKGYRYYNPKTHQTLTS